MRPNEISLATARSHCAQRREFGTAGQTPALIGFQIPHNNLATALRYYETFAWCERRGLPLASIRPHDVGTYMEHLQGSAPSVKQQLAAIRMMFDWLVVGQIVQANPASPVRGPTHVVKTGTTPVLEGGEWRKLLDSIPTVTLRDLRDRALIATLTYSFARVTAALSMKVEDLRPRGAQPLAA